MDGDFALLIRSFTALAFLPSQGVLEDLANTENLPDDEGFQQFVSYFEATYIGPEWNERDRVPFDLPRTNNPVEAFFNSSKPSSAKPDIWKFTE